MSFIKDNGGILTVLGVAVILLAGYAEWRISEAVEKELAATVPASKAAVDANTESITDLEATDVRMDNKIERIVDILLED